MTEMARVEAELSAKWPETKLEPSLDRIRDLVYLLGQPQQSFQVIHVAGTNGKTSTVRMIDALLRAFGLRTGRFTSPHLDTVRERIAIDGSPLDEDTFVAVYNEIAPYVALVDQRHPTTPMSYFEVLAGMAYAAFADAPVDVAVVETGMGGTWDATNVADGRVAVVMPIELDHQQYLGDSIEQIAGEKAGIIKPGATAILAVQPPEAATVLLTRAAAVGATVAREGMEFGVRHRDVAVGGQLVAIQGLAGLYEDVFLPLHGEHQAQNAACALAAVEAFLADEKDALDVDVVRSAFAGTSSPGRLEVVRRSPTIVVDAAHNPHGAQALAAALEESFAFTTLVGIVAVLGDKDAYGLLETLEPVLSHVVVTVNSSPRALPVGELAQLAEEVFGAERVSIAARMDDAIDVAVRLADEADLYGGGTGVVATGSVVTVADVRRLLGAPAEGS
jgi:dihydrofolate synthase / folylpolyglutamate synthase